MGPRTEIDNLTLPTLAESEYMAHLTTLSKEASQDPHSLLTTGCYAPKYLPSRKHFPDATRSRVCVCVCVCVWVRE